MAESYVFNVNVADDQGNKVQFHCTPKNTELYLFGGAWKAADHFFHRQDQLGNAGAFIWRSILGSDQFDEIANRVIESETFCYFFKPVPEGADLQYFLDYEAQDVTTLPDGWA